MERSKTISRNGFSVTVTEANVLMGTRRGLAQLQAFERLEGEDDLALKIIKGTTYPNLIGAVEDSSGFSEWPVSLSEFMELPESFVVEWEQAVYSLNPHWQPGYSSQTDEEKKANISESSSGSNGK